MRWLQVDAGLGDRFADEEQALTRLATGDTTALATLYDRYASAVYALLVRIVGDQRVAEELLQEVFVRVWQRSATYERRRGRPLTWVLGIAHNLAIDEVRRRRRRPQELIEGEEISATMTLAAIPGDEPDPADLAWERMRHAAITAALRQLPPAQQAIIELAYFKGFTQSQIAAYLDEPLGTVKTRLRLGLQKMRDLLRQQEVDWISEPER